MMKNYKRLKVIGGGIVVIIPLIVVLLQILGSGSSMTTVVIPGVIPTTEIDISAQAQRFLLNIRNELGADAVWVEEYFLTPLGKSRGV